MKLDYLAPVHRLDKVTSGCLLLAKNQTAASFLSKQFKERTTEKIYIAITKGKPKKKQGTIRGDMVPARNGCWKLAKTQNNPAITQFKSIGYNNGLRIVNLKILTGKTHQIRVAMKSIGSPVWGDERYGNVTDNAGADRCYLHSYKLSFDDLSGERKTVIA